MPVMVCWSVGLWFDPWQGLQSGAECSSDGGGVQRRKASDCWLVGWLVGWLLDVVRPLRDDSTLSEANWHK